MVLGSQAAEGASEPWLLPYSGPTRSDVDATTLDGKVLCGYQGWFNTLGDGSDFGWVHLCQGLDRGVAPRVGDPQGADPQGRPGGGRFTVDMWPDLSEYDPQDLAEVPGLKM